jgi:hypothetical protein
MKRIKKFEQFVNEENLIKNLGYATAYGLSVLGTPEAIGQDVNAGTEIVGKYGADALEQTKGVPVTKQEIITYMDDLVLAAPDFISDNGSQLANTYVLSSVEEVPDFDFYRVIVQDEQGNKYEIYISKAEFEDYKENSVMSLSIMNQFLECEPGSNKIRRADTYYFQRK